MHWLRPFLPSVCLAAAGCAAVLGVDDPEPTPGSETEPVDTSSSGEPGSSGASGASSGASSSSGASGSSGASSSSSAGGSGTGSSSSSGSASSSGSPADPVRQVDLAYPAWPLPPSHPLPASYDVIGAMVYDRTTGLTWERAPTLAGGTRPQAAAYCSTLSLGGYTDWRLPSRIELISLLDLGVSEPPWIEAAAFPEMGSAGYWSQSLLALPTAEPQYWVIHFQSGFASYAFGTVDTRAVRCVRGTEQAFPAPVQFQAFPETVRDLHTNLLWQRDSYDHVLVTLAEAVLFCADLTLDGQSGFRVPTLRELHSIVNERTESYAIDQTYFGRGIHSHWTTTTRVGSPQEAMVVNFTILGTGGSLDKTDQARVRCVK